MRDPTDLVDLPDHLTWQMNMGIDHNQVSHAATGILGETFVPTTDDNGERIMSGMESIRGKQEDCEFQILQRTVKIVVNLMGWLIFIAKQTTTSRRRCRIINTTWDILL